MQFGIFSNGQRHNTRAADTFAEDLWEIAEADRLGYDVAWISEHWAIRQDVVSTTDVLIGKAAAMTKRIRLGPAVRILPALHPLDVAASATMADHLSDGRYMLGIGAGTEFKMAMDHRGYDHAERHDRLLESLELILRSWTSTEPFDYQGRFWSGTGVVVHPKPYQRPHPPIGVATDQDDVIRLAAERGYTLLAAQYDGPAYLKRKGDVLADALRSRGRPPSRATYTVARMIHVADTDAQAYDNIRADVDRDFAYQKTIAPRSIEFFRSRIPGLVDVTLAHMSAAGAYFVGNHETVYQQLAEFYRTSGGFGTFLLVMGKDWGSREARSRSLELFQEQVAPRLTRLAQDFDARVVAERHEAAAQPIA